MSAAGWFYRSFANRFTLCLIVSLVFQALLAVSCTIFSAKAGRLGADSGKGQSLFHTL